jgi:hypothetical protein
MSSFGTDAHLDKLVTREVSVRTRFNTETRGTAAPADGDGKAGDLWFVQGNATATVNGVYYHNGTAWQQVAQMNQ